MFDENYRFYLNPNRIAALKAAYAYQHGGPQPPYATLRILEKQSKMSKGWNRRLIEIYRSKDETTLYDLSLERWVRRPTILTVIVLHAGLVALGLDDSPAI